MPKVLVLMEGETVGQSLLKDSYSLLTNLLLLFVAIRFDNTNWTVVAGILIMFLVTSRVIRDKTTRCQSPHEAIVRVCQYYNMSAEIISEPRHKE